MKVGLIHVCTVYTCMQLTHSEAETTETRPCLTQILQGRRGYVFVRVHISAKCSCEGMRQ